MGDKEAVVVILDVGTPMGASLAKARAAVSEIVMQKLLYKPKDEMCVILVGTKGTDNHLARDLQDEYLHVTTLSDLAPIDLNLVTAVENVQSGESAEGDLIDALVVALDILHRRTATRKVKRRLFMLTDGGMPVADADDLDVILGRVSELNVKVNVIGVNFSDPLNENAEQLARERAGKSKVKLANEAMLYQMAAKVQGAVVPLARSLELMSYLRSRSTAFRASFRGELEVADVKINVMAYAKTSLQRFPTLKKVSSIAVAAEKDGQAAAGDGGGAAPADTSAKRQIVHRSTTDPDTIVEEDKKIKGYKYGKQYIPFGATDEDFLKFKAEKSLKVLGFTSIQNVPRYHLLSNIVAFVGTPNKLNDQATLSSLIHALHELDKVAIVRYVRTAAAPVQLGVMFPQIKDEFEALYYCKLPFAEDLRSFYFAPLDKFKIQPSEAQLQAAEDVIRSMTLMRSADEEDSDDEPMELLKPKHTYNPSLQHFYQTLAYRARTGKSDIPELNPVVARYVNVDERIAVESKDQVAAFARLFPLALVDRGAKRDRDAAENRYGEATAAVKVPGVGKPGYENAAEDAVPAKKVRLGGADGISLADVVQADVTRVGSATPVEDFKSLMERRDADFVDTALAQLQQVILELVESSIRDQKYAKALECIRVMRVYAKKEDEAEVFNQFMTSLKAKFMGGARDAFWQAIVGAGIGLLTREDSADTTLTQEDAASFFAAASASADVSMSANDDEDDLLGLVD